jgi:hypothetical protein
MPPTPCAGGFVFMANSKTNFTHIGRSFTADKETDWNKAFDQLQWQDVPCDLPTMQGLGIKGMIQQLNLPPAVRVAWSAAVPVPDGCALLAAEFKVLADGHRQHFQVFALDTGDSLTPLGVRDFEF